MDSSGNLRSLRATNPYSVNINNDARADYHQEQAVQKSFEDELRMDLLATQSLGPRLSEAFDLVRMIDFEGPWVSSNDWRMLAAMNKARRSLQLPGNGLGFDSEDGVQVNICLKINSVSFSVPWTTCLPQNLVVVGSKPCCHPL